MRYLFLLLLLCGCSVDGSKALIDNAQKEVISIQDTIKKFENATPVECKTDLFLANLDSIGKQINSVSGQIEIIGTACKSEKEVLEGKIISRNIIIIVLCLVILVAGILFVRKKL